jgi:hypothetical protein
VSGDEIKTITVPEQQLDVVALVDPAVPKIYANGFTLGLTNADVQIVLKLFGRPIAVLSFSYTLAKTISEKLSRIVTEWEEKTGNTLANTDAIDKAFTSKPQGTDGSK